MKKRKSIPDLFNPDMPTAPAVQVQEKQVSIWKNSNNSFCFVVLKNEKSYIYICPVCRTYNQWDKIHTGVCYMCNSRKGKGFEIDLETKIALVPKNTIAKEKEETLAKYDPRNYAK